jgi:tetratricopeptide (TPR) repeat protein
MKTKISNILRWAYLALILVTVSCKKQDDFLNTKPIQSLSTISTISDVQNLMNNERIFNEFATPSWGEAYTDDFYITSDNWLGGLGEVDQKYYLFSKQIFGATDKDYSWNSAYQQVYYSNIVLDALPKISASQIQLNQVKGTALFYRAFAFYDLVQTYAMPYDSITAKSDMGIPLRLTPDLNIKSIRASEADCYNRIISDIQASIQLLPTTTQFNTSPNKTAANALLARIYLGMAKYDLALQYSNAALSLNNSLMDYNKLIITPYYLTDASQFPLKEDIFHRTLNSGPYGFGTGSVDSTLLKSFDDNDIRKSVFFLDYSNIINFIGSYELNKFGELFCGLAVDEMYLTRAEANARLGRVAEAMSDLNTLLINRYKTGTFVQRTAISAQDALDQIILERRKELCFRGIRSLDIRRLNKDSHYAITLKHVINGVTYLLPPNDPRYAMEIPPDEIKLSGIQQNQR